MIRDKKKRHDTVLRAGTNPKQRSSVERQGGELKDKYDGSDLVSLTA